MGPKACTLRAELDTAQSPLFLAKAELKKLTHTIDYKDPTALKSGICTKVTENHQTLHFLLAFVDLYAEGWCVVELREWDIIAWFR